MIPEYDIFEGFFCWLVLEPRHCNRVKSLRGRVLNLCENLRTNYGWCVFKPSVFWMKLAQQIAWLPPHFAAILKFTADIFFFFWVNPIWMAFGEKPVWKKCLCLMNEFHYDGHPDAYIICNLSPKERRVVSVSNCLKMICSCWNGVNATITIATALKTLLSIM